MSSRITIPRPVGFIDAEEFEGYVQPSTNAAIILQRFPCGWSESLAGLSSEQTLEKGMTLRARKDLAVDEGPRAVLYFTQEAADVELDKWIAVLGDEQQSALVIGVASAELPDMIGESLLAALYGARWKSVGAEATGLRIAGANVGGMSVAQDDGTAIVWTLGGKFPLERPRDPLLLVTRVRVDVEPAQLPDFAVSHLFSLSSLANQRPECVQTTPIAGVTGIELTATAVDATSQQNLFVYQVVFGKRRKWYVVVGIAAESYRREFLPTFKFLASTLRFDQPPQDAPEYSPDERFQFD